MDLGNSQSAEKSIRFLDAGITAGWEPPDVGAGN